LKTQLSIFLATMAGWLNRKQHGVIMYLHTENEILKEQLEKKGVKLKLSNAQRYKLAKKGQCFMAKTIRIFQPDVVASLMGSYTQSAKFLFQQDGFECLQLREALPPLRSRRLHVVLRSFPSM